MFGKQTLYNADGSVREAAQPGLLGLRRDNSTVVRDWRSIETRILNVAGINVYPIDVQYKMGNRQREIFYIGLEIADAAKKLRRRYETATTEGERNEIEQKLKAAELTYTKLRYDYLSIKQWAADRNIDFNAAMQMRQRNQRLMTQQLLSDEESEKILNQIEQELYGDN